MVPSLSIATTSYAPEFRGLVTEFFATFRLTPLGSSTNAFTSVCASGIPSMSPCRRTRKFRRPRNSENRMSGKKSRRTSSRTLLSLYYRGAGVAPKDLDTKITRSSASSTLTFPSPAVPSIEGFWGREFLPPRLRHYPAVRSDGVGRCDSLERQWC